MEEHYNKNDFPQRIINDTRLKHAVNNSFDGVPNYVQCGYSVWFQEEQEVGDEDEEVIFKIGVAANRGIAFDEARYNNFIDLQDKLHQNICRTLVAIGTHDLDTIQGPFSYEALPPQEINFVPLKQEKIFRVDELLEYYKSNMKLKKFLHIIENSPAYPVIYDRNR
ncbi:phenylalanine--tRNA ligase beta subunit, cytoplasmic-like [Zingiber officinale]|uniref:phenylalanine--tRNA ligase beta subunit, cytoplasmic-like n=1 Tax=Zingiber officinale TaxID=94328 RepID=UPI001C4D4F5A|nr:phenylalanine--tRNA ligase beta subunit, cytoplasmic-like [Zingiber officinale]